MCGSSSWLCGRRAFRQLKHPNVVRLIGVYEAADYVHLVTEFMAGGELFDRIVEKVWPTLRST